MICQQMIGHIGFHTQPGAPYLQEIAPAGVEFGYTVYEPSVRTICRRYTSRTTLVLRKSPRSLMKWMG